MAIESIISSASVHHTLQQKDDTSALKKDVSQNTNINIQDEIKDQTSTSRDPFVSEVKELLEHVKNGTMETKEVQTKMESLKNQAITKNNFTYQHSLDFAKVDGSLMISQANISQSTVSKLLS